MFRNIIERSPMVNNDEIISYSELELDINQVTDTGKRLVLSRKIFLQENLNTGFSGEKHKEKISILTDMIDQFFIVNNDIKFSKKLWGDDSKALAHNIAYDYYNCMSGGCPKNRLIIYKTIALNDNIDKSTEVYPHEDKYITIQDFLDDMKDLPVFEMTELKLLTGDIFV